MEGEVEVVDAHRLVERHSHHGARINLHGVIAWKNRDDFGPPIVRRGEAEELCRAEGTAHQVSGHAPAAIGLVQDHHVVGGLALQELSVRQPHEPLAAIGGHEDGRGLDHARVGAEVDAQGVHAGRVHRLAEKNFRLRGHMDVARAVGREGADDVRIGFIEPDVAQVHGLEVVRNARVQSGDAVDQRGVGFQVEVADGNEHEREGTVGLRARQRVARDGALRTEGEQHVHAADGIGAIRAHEPAEDIAAGPKREPHMIQRLRVGQDAGVIDAQHEELRHEAVGAQRPVVEMEAPVGIREDGLLQPVEQRRLRDERDHRAANRRDAIAQDNGARHFAGPGQAEGEVRRVAQFVERERDLRGTVGCAGPEIARPHLVRTERQISEGDATSRISKSSARHWAGQSDGSVDGEIGAIGQIHGAREPGQRLDLHVHLQGGDVFRQRGGLRAGTLRRGVRRGNGERCRGRAGKIVRAVRPGGDRARRCQFVLHIQCHHRPGNVAGGVAVDDVAADFTPRLLDQRHLVGLAIGAQRHEGLGTDTVDRILSEQPVSAERHAIDLKVTVGSNGVTNVADGDLRGIHSRHAIAQYEAAFDRSRGGEPNGDVVSNATNYRHTGPPHACKAGVLRDANGISTLKKVLAKICSIGIGRDGATVIREITLLQHDARAGSGSDSVCKEHLNMHRAFPLQPHMAGIGDARHDGDPRRAAPAVDKVFGLDKITPAPPAVRTERGNVNLRIVKPVGACRDLELKGLDPNFHSSLHRRAIGIEHEPHEPAIHLLHGRELEDNVGVIELVREAEAGTRDDFRIERRCRLQHPRAFKHAQRKFKRAQRRVAVALAANDRLRRAGDVRPQARQPHARPDGNALAVDHPAGDGALAQECDVGHRCLAIEADLLRGKAPRQRIEG